MWWAVCVGTAVSGHTLYCLPMHANMYCTCMHTHAPHTCMHTHAHTHHTHACIHMHTPQYTCMHTIHMCVCTCTHSSRLQACYEEMLGEKSFWSEMCMLYNAYCAKLSNIGAMSSTEFLTVLRWALPRTHWAVAWSYCTGRLVFCLDFS